jgi:hypothetical protein
MLSSDLTKQQKNKIKTENLTEISNIFFLFEKYYLNKDG